MALTHLRKQYLGSETPGPEHDHLFPPFVKEILAELTLRDPKKGKALDRYYHEMKRGLKEMHRVLKPSRCAVIVVASSVLKGMDVHTHKCLGDIAKSVGFELAGIGTRSIHRDRRMMPVSNDTSKSGIESRMHDEFILGLWKP